MVCCCEKKDKLLKEGIGESGRVHPLFRDRASYLFIFLIVAFVGFVVYYIIIKAEERHNPPIETSLTDEDWELPLITM
jgi:hypothetical protein